MGKDSGDAPMPDPNIKKAANAQAATGNAWLNFANDAYATAQGRQTGIDATAGAVSGAALGAQDTALTNAATDRARYENTFVPLQDQIINDAKNYDTPEAQAAAAAAAGADTQSAIAGQRAATERQQASMGVNPNSGRFQGTQRASDLNSALAVAGAKNDARETTRNTGQALRMNAAQLGANLPQQSLASTQVGLGAGSAATGALTQANQQFLTSTAIPMQGYSGQMQGYAGQAATLGNLYNAQLSAYNAQNSANAANTAGLYSALGTGLGAAASFFSSEEVKTDKEEIPEGAALAAVDSLPVERWRYMPGIEDGGEHVGPYAEDMQRVTGLGDGKSIKVQDALGLTMKAVQDVSRKVDRIAQQVGLGAYPGNRGMEAA